LAREPAKIDFKRNIQTGKTMSRLASFMSACALATLSLTANAQADNSPVVRDCSFGSTPAASPDADFVLLSSPTLKLRNGVLSILTSENTMTLTASESVDTNDNQGKVQLFATVSAPGTPTQSFFASGTGFANVGIPVSSSSVGQVFTIAWHATFDGGQHACPSATTPANTSPIPFVVTAVKH
jgi:hypothetical protein